MERLKARAEQAEAELARVRHAQQNSPWYAAGGPGGEPDDCPYHYLIDKLDAAVVFVDADLIMRHVNNYVADFVGQDRGKLEDIPVRKLLELVVPPGPDHDVTIERLLTAPFAPCTDEIEVLRADGSEAFFSVAQRPVRDDEGNALGTIVIGTDITAQRETERRLARYQRSLRSLGAELALSEERQRRSIATRIHDEISQNLACAKLRVSSLSQCPHKACQDMIEKVNDLLDSAIAGSRSLAFELSPPLLHELGFIEAVEWLTEQFEDRYEVDVEFVDDGRGKPLAQDVSVTLFRALNELLTNVVTHADAHHATVSVSRSDDHVEVRVSDDGHGFIPAATVLEESGPANGYGLFNISERLGYLGGNMQIESSDLTGTQVTLTAPIDGAGAGDHSPPCATISASMNSSASSGT